MTEPVSPYLYLLQIFTPEQIRQLASVCEQAKLDGGELVDVIVRFKNGNPRWIGRGPLWEELEKPQ